MPDSEQQAQEDEPKVFTARPRPNRRPRVVTPPPAPRRADEAEARESSDASAETAAS